MKGEIQKRDCEYCKEIKFCKLLPDPYKKAYYNIKELKWTCNDCYTMFIESLKNETTKYKP